MITYKYTGLEIRCQKLAKLAIKHHLYINGFMLKHYLETRPISRIALAYANQTPIGVAVKFSDSGRYSPTVGVFVKPEFRHKGIGKKLMIRLQIEDYDTYAAGQNRKLSHLFFQKCGLSNCIY